MPSPIGSQVCYIHRLTNDMFPAINLWSLCIARCIKRTKEITEQVPINMFFEQQGKKRPSASEEQGQKKKTSSDQSTPCAGISDETWTRPESVHWIEDCITQSPSIYHGAPPRHQLCQELFGMKESELDTEQKDKLAKTIKARSTWRIERSGHIKAIFSTSCKLQIPRSFVFGKLVVVCENCEALRSHRSLISAINTTYAQGDMIKHTRKDYISEDLFQARRRRYAELDILAKSLESSTKAGDHEFWRSFCAHACKGVFNHLEAFKGLIKAISVRTEREANGKGTTGMTFQTDFDNFVMTLAAMSPKAAQLFTNNFAGQTARSQRHLRKITGMQLQDGLCSKFFEKVSQHLLTIGYDGPVCVASDQTVCVKSLRVQNQALFGAQGGDVSFHNEADLKAKCKSIIEGNQMCSKVFQIFFSSQNKSHFELRDEC